MNIKTLITTIVFGIIFWAVMIWGVFYNSAMADDLTFTAGYGYLYTNAEIGADRSNDQYSTTFSLRYTYDSFNGCKWCVAGVEGIHVSDPTIGPPFNNKFYELQTDYVGVFIGAKIWGN